MDESNCGQLLLIMFVFMCLQITVYILSHFRKEEYLEMVLPLVSSQISKSVGEVALMDCTCKNISSRRLLWHGFSDIFKSRTGNKWKKEGASEDQRKTFLCFCYLRGSHRASFYRRDPGIYSR